MTKPAPSTHGSGRSCARHGDTRRRRAARDPRSSASRGRIDVEERDLGDAETRVRQALEPAAARGRRRRRRSRPSQPSPPPWQRVDAAGLPCGRGAYAIARHEGSRRACRRRSRRTRNPALNASPAPVVSTGVTAGAGAACSPSRAIARLPSGPRLMTMSDWRACQKRRSPPL